MMALSVSVPLKLEDVPMTLSGQSPYFYEVSSITATGRKLAEAIAMSVRQVTVTLNFISFL